ncbi:MAG: hypothetical protein ACLUTF_04625 [Anaerostipes hadrus]
MKKILASIMMLSLMFCLSACNVPWQKKDTQKEVKERSYRQIKCKEPWKE